MLFLFKLPVLIKPFTSQNTKICEFQDEATISSKTALAEVIDMCYKELENYLTASGDKNIGSLS